MTKDAYEAAGWAKSSPNILKFWSSSGETYTFQDFSVVAGTPILLVYVPILILMMAV